jgi:hypothetical protein
MTKADIMPDNSRPAESKRHPAKRTDCDYDERRRLPCSQQHEANKCDPEVAGTLDRSRPNRIVKGCAQ